jgi:fructose/tagatose bisphosphate aldolase
MAHQTQQATVQPFSDVAELSRSLDGIATIRDGQVEIQDTAAFRGALIDRLVFTAVFGEDSIKPKCRWLIRVAAPKLGAFPASIHELYMAAGRGDYANMTTPAINVRGLTYDVVRTIYRAARANDCKMVLVELARSEMGYTEQRPAEYASCILAAAIKENHQGPVFIQGDHYQLSATSYAKDPAAEVRAVHDLAIEAVAAGYGNIDIDASTLVDLSLRTISEQQIVNARHTAELTRAIRETEPANLTISIGGEIGEVGAQNSTVEDLTAFMDRYVEELATQSAAAGRDLTGISKISVQTGTSHGGIPLADGTIKEVAVDFDTLAELSTVARERYGMGGAVQHGASTLPEESFDQFAAANAVEVHLATAFQNMMYDSQSFPVELKNEIYRHLAAEHGDERKPDQTDAQFYYTTRKKGFGPFKRQLWDLPEETRAGIMADLEPTFSLIMQRLGVRGSAGLVDRIIKPIEVSVPAPDGVDGLTPR